MKNNRSIQQHYPGLLAVMILAVILLGGSSPSFASTAADVPVDDGQKAIEETIKVEKALVELLESMNIEAFTYETEDRPDPFTPFISEKVVQPLEGVAQEEEKLTGMRQFEPGQLSLVAIMFTESNPMAMVEDSSHKGYIIRRGTKIGRSGIVSDILPNQVIIKQLSYSMAREKRYKTVEMILRKEGEK